MASQKEEQGFRCVELPIEENLFGCLKESVGFEGVCKGRQGTVVVAYEEKRGTPIVRTTTQYHSPPFCFQKIHEKLIQMIQEAVPAVGGFNNGLVECYNNSYFRMGFHSDQAQDLEEGSFIAIFSCYKDPDIAKRHPRRLVVQSKTDDSKFEIPMGHNSIVVFSLETNCRFKHKIVLNTGVNPPDNEWLGITLRRSKTFVKSALKSQARIEAVFEDGTPVLLADDNQRKEFFQMRRQENQEIDFLYPHLAYTISPSDIMLPIQETEVCDEPTTNAA